MDKFNKNDLEQIKLMAIRHGSVELSRYMALALIEEMERLQERNAELERQNAYFKEVTKHMPSHIKPKDTTSVGGSDQ